MVLNWSRSRGPRKRRPLSVDMNASLSRALYGHTMRGEMLSSRSIDNDVRYNRSMYVLRGLKVKPAHDTHVRNALIANVLECLPSGRRCRLSHQFIHSLGRILKSPGRDSPDHLDASAFIAPSGI